MNLINVSTIAKALTYFITQLIIIIVFYRILKYFHLQLWIILANKSRVLLAKL